MTTETTAPNPCRTTYDDITEAAAKHGWTRRRSPGVETFTRATERLITEWGRNGITITGYEHATAGLLGTWGTAWTRGKRAAVLAILTADPGAADPTCGQCGSPRSSNRHRSPEGHSFVAPAELDDDVTLVRGVTEGIASVAEIEDDDG